MKKYPLDQQKILVDLGAKFNSKIENPKYRHGLQEKSQKERNLEASKFQEYRRRGFYSTLIAPLTGLLVNQSL